jgi:hypothetical protein
LGGSLRQCWFFSGNQIGYITGGSHFLKPLPPEPNQRILLFWYAPPESSHQIIYFCYLPPELTRKKVLKSKNLEKNGKEPSVFEISGTDWYFDSDS